MAAQRAVERRPRIANPRTVRAATQRRISRTSRAHYTGLGRVLIGLGCTLTLLMAYVVLTSNLTGLSYAVGRAASQREALVEETMRLDDRISAMRSDDRLAALASRLGMTVPHRFAVLRLAPEHVAQSHTFPVLSSLAGFFVPAVTRQQ